MDPAKIKDNLILRLTIQFSVSVMDFHDRLIELKKFVIAKQLLRSATSIGANAMEAQQGESNADFVHKMKIAAKEAAETQYWLILCEEAGGYPSTSELLTQLDSITRVLNSIIATSKTRR